MRGDRPAGAVWRAELAHLLAHGLGEAVGVLGYERKAAQPTEQGGATTLTRPAPPTPSVMPQDRGAPLSLLLCTEAVAFTPDAPEAAPTEVLSEAEITSASREVGAPPAAPTITSWPRLAPKLRRLVCADQAARSVDLRRLIKRLARAEIVGAVPRRRWRGWPRRLHLWVRKADHLVTHWADHTLVQGALRRQLGSTLVVTELTDAEVRGQLVRTGLAGPVSDALVGGTVLLLGHEGEREGERAGWVRTAQALRRVQARLVVLGCRGGSFGGAPALAWSHGRALDPDTRRARALRLLRLVSPAALVQPGLVRALRLLLPLGEADEATEVHALQLQQVEAVDESHLLLRPAARRELLQEFFTQEQPELRQQVRDTIARWHERSPAAVRHAETLLWAQYDPVVPPAGDLASAQAFLSRLDGSLVQGRSGQRAIALKLYGRQLLATVPTPAYHHPTLGPTFTRLWALAHEGRANVAVPDGVSAAAIASAMGPAPVAPIRWVVMQHGAALRFEPHPADGSVPVRPPLAWVRASRWVVVTVDGARRKLELRPGLRVPLAGIGPVEVETEVERVVLTPWERPGWAQAAGRDRYGVWAEVAFAGVVQRFRWVPPGRFLMGSPEGEVGRSGREGLQHIVTLTEGFWMGDTPVTQALWEAVTGRRPSRFEGERRPVEQVSWRECVAFTEELARLAPPGAPVPRLPTEAEWEYACRAGTAGATWRGELDLRGDNDAPLLDEIAWYGGNSGEGYPYADGVDSSGWPEKQYAHERAGTREVATRAANPWGLHDLLGNVYEWCQDAWGLGAYEEGEVVNPLGEVGTARVIRGGSWLSLARDVRAACRRGVRPDFRDGVLGLRLAAGPGQVPQPGADAPLPGAADHTRASQTRDASKRARVGRRRRDEP